MNSHNIKMKNSNIDWIGNIPSDWSIVPVSKLFTVSKSKIKEGLLNPLSVGYIGVVPQIENAAQNAANGDRKHVQKGDIVINSRSDRMGAVGLSEYEGGVSLVYHVMRPKSDDFMQKYYHYVYRSRMFSQEFYKRGQGIVADLWSTKDSELKRISIPEPPEETQQKIVDFLDEKTANIDTLVTKKKKMIELLEEKRSSLITHAVTKGLDPHVKMKDSGVEWIGKIPVSWNIKKQKYLFKSIVKKMFSDNQVALENIESWTGKYIKTDGEYAGGGVYFEKNDILFGKLRPYLAKVFMAGESGEALGDILVYRAKSEILFEFGHKMLLSKNVIDYINASTYGTKMPRVNPDFIRSLYLIYPRIEDQEKIFQFLKKEIKKIDLLISTVKKQINLLNEYKQSLIYHAVTGKIDV